MCTRVALKFKKSTLAITLKGYLYNLNEMCRIHQKTLVMKSFFNKNAGLLKKLFSFDFWKTCRATVASWDFRNINWNTQAFVCFYSVNCSKIIEKQILNRFAYFMLNLIYYFAKISPRDVFSFQNYVIINKNYQIINWNIKFLMEKRHF